MKILVIGESCRDIFHYGICERLCPDAPVPVFKPTHTIENKGMAMNVKANLEALGAEVGFYTNDNYKDLTKTRYVDSKTNHMFIRIDIGEEEYGKANVKILRYDDYDAVVISDYNKGFLTEKDIQYIANRHPITFLDTKKPIGDWCENISFIKINNHEFKKAEKNLSQKIKDKLIITTGPEGAIHKGKKFPVPQVEIKDSSGAGDTFIAALTVKFLQTRDIEWSIRTANAAATKVVQKKGVTTV